MLFVDGQVLRIAVDVGAPKNEPRAIKSGEFQEIKGDKNVLSIERVRRIPGLRRRSRTGQVNDRIHGRQQPVNLLPIGEIDAVPTIRNGEGDRFPRKNARGGSTDESASSREKNAFPWVHFRHNDSASRQARS